VNLNLVINTSYEMKDLSSGEIIFFLAASVFFIALAVKNNSHQLAKEKITWK